MTEYAKEQVSNFAKVEAAIGLGITTLITNFVVQSALTGADMPTWAMWVLLLLVIVFLVVRVLAIVQFIIEKEVYLREQKVQGELKIKELTAQCSKMELEAKMQRLRSEIAALEAKQGV